MTHHAGIDVSLATSSICIVDAAGAIVRELEAPSEPEALAAALRATGLPFARVGLEAGPLSPSGACRCPLPRRRIERVALDGSTAGLVEVALPVVRLETRRLRAATRSMPVKTDRTDARAIAQVARTGPRPSADGRPCGNHRRLLPPMVPGGAREARAVPR